MGYCCWMKVNQLGMTLAFGLSFWDNGMLRLWMFMSLISLIQWADFKEIHKCATFTRLDNGISRFKLFMITYMIIKILQKKSLHGTENKQP